MGLFGNACAVRIALTDEDQRKKVKVKSGKSEEELLLFVGDETVAGRVHVDLKPGKRMEHLGIKIEFVGAIESAHERSDRYEFTSVVRELACAGTMSESQTFPFEFVNVEKPYESYQGENVRLRYFLRVTVARSFMGTVTETRDLVVRVYQEEPEINNPAKTEVGIEHKIHIEFDYLRTKYHLSDVVIGKIYFLMVRIKVTRMVISFRKHESVGVGEDAKVKSTLLTSFELMDGAPVRGCSIPIRLFLGAHPLTPTYKNVQNKFSVRYSLDLVLIEEQGTRYFRKQEIQLYRKDPALAGEYPAVGMELVGEAEEGRLE